MSCAAVPRKSNLVDQSLAGWLTPLSSSCRSTLLTMSNDGSATSLLPYSNASACRRYPFAPPGSCTAILTCAVAPRCGGTHEAGCPSGQWERTVNPSRKLPRFESLTRHMVTKRPPTSRNASRGPSASVPPGPTEIGRGSPAAASAWQRFAGDDLTDRSLGGPTDASRLPGVS